MSERKVLNKYYPPDFDPSKIPRIKLARNRQYTVRLMAPFNMRCVTCGEYIYKGKKFNARKEDVENEDYLGIRIYRFYIKCTRCLQEISFKTDPKNTDYEIEAGATRNFMALKLAEEQAKREEDQLKEEEANNPMKLLENRTEQSKNEIALLESLEELKDLNRRQQDIDYDTMLQQFQPKETAKERQDREEREDEEFIKSVKFNKPSILTSNSKVVDEEIIELNEERPSAKLLKTSTAGDVASGSRPVINDSSGESSTTNGAIPKPPLIIRPTPSAKPNHAWNKSIGVLSKKSSLSGLVNINKKPVPTSSSSSSTREVSKEDSNRVTEENKNAESKGVANGLSLLAGYSDSDSNSD